jgi:hypothetical protein
VARVSLAVVAARGERGAASESRWSGEGAGLGLYSPEARQRMESEDQGEGFGDGVFGRRRLVDLGRKTTALMGGVGVSTGGSGCRRSRGAGPSTRRGMGKEGVGHAVWSGPAGAAAVLLGCESRPS